MDKLFASYQGEGGYPDWSVDTIEAVGRGRTDVIIACIRSWGLDGQCLESKNKPEIHWATNLRPALSLLDSSEIGLCDLQ